MGHSPSDVGREALEGCIPGIGVRGLLARRPSFLPQAGHFDDTSHRPLLLSRGYR